LFKISDKVVFRKVENKIVLINLENGYYYSLNKMGGFIFNSIRDGRHTSNILNDIKRDFDVSESKAEDDFNSFIEELKEEAILYSV